MTKTAYKFSSVSNLFENLNLTHITDNILSDHGIVNCKVLDKVDGIYNVGRLYTGDGKEIGEYRIENDELYFVIRNDDYHIEYSITNARRVKKTVYEKRTRGLIISVEDDEFVKTNVDGEIKLVNNKIDVKRMVYSLDTINSFENTNRPQINLESARNLYHQNEKLQTGKNSELVFNYLTFFEPVKNMYLINSSDYKPKTDFKSDISYSSKRLSKLSIEEQSEEIENMNNVFKSVYKKIGTKTPARAIYSLFFGMINVYDYKIIPLISKLDNPELFYGLYFDSPIGKEEVKIVGECLAATREEYAKRVNELLLENNSLEDEKGKVVKL